MIWRGTLSAPISLLNKKYQTEGEAYIEKQNSGNHNTGFRCYSYRAIDGTRTRDFHLGKVALYQLSHYRILFNVLRTKNILL